MVERNEDEQRRFREERRGLPERGDVNRRPLLDEVDEAGEDMVPETTEENPGVPNGQLRRARKR